MKILVTGHKGFIGQNMVKALEKKHKVTGYEWGEKFPKFDFDQVIHLGAISSTTETNVEKVMTQNYDFSVWLLEMCNHKGANFQYASSASIYGMGSEFKEDSPVDPRSPYAWSKYLFERYTQHRNWLVTVQGFRYFNVYGPHEDHKGKQASPYHQFTQQAKIDREIKVFEKSDVYRRDFVPVQQVIDTHQAFFNIKESGIWNLGTGTTKSFLEIAQEIGEKYDVGYRFIPMPENLRQSYQKYTCADVSKIRKTLA